MSVCLGSSFQQLDTTISGQQETPFTKAKDTGKLEGGNELLEELLTID